MIKLIDAHCSFGSRAILDRVSWMLGDQDRVGLVGENGSGKTTLLKVMAGLSELERGQVERSRGLRIGYLPQEGVTHAGHTLEQEAREALRPILALQEEADQLENLLVEGALSPEEQEKLIHRMTDLMERFQICGGYEIEGRVGRVLTGLGFSNEEFQRPVETFSGGWQMRIALAKLLLEQPQVLLLDEPTNHLDLEARNWLEEFLRDYPYAFLIVSHDRYFLDVTIKRIVEVESGRLTDYRGNYSYYVAEKEKRVSAARSAYERQQEEIQRLKAFINKYKADKKRAGQVHSRMKMLDKIDQLEAPKETKTVHFRFPDPPRGPREMIVVKDLTKSYGPKTVLSGVSLVVYRGEKVAVVGHNGAGKSTLLEIMGGRKDHNRGEVKVNSGVELAVFTQDAGQELESGDTVMQGLSRNAPFDMYPRLRSLLGAFLFSGEDADKKVGVLSGGEKSRLALAKLLLRSSNLIILDEPTNHLDLRAKEVLMEAFRNYKGTLVFVAHDRYFLEGLPDRILEVSGGKINSYLGDYSSYLYAKAREASGEKTETVESKPVVPAQPAPVVNNKPISQAPPKPEPKEAPEEDKSLQKNVRLRKRDEEKQKQRAEQKRKRRIRELEQIIADAERQQRFLEEQMHDPRIANDYVKIMALENERQEIDKKLEAVYQEWDELAGEG